MKTYQINLIKFFMLLAILAMALINLSAQATKNSLEFSFTPAGGHRFYSPANSYSPDETPGFSYGFSMEYQRHVGQRISIGVGLEYQNLRYAYHSDYTAIDSSNNPVNMGTIDMHTNHHYIGVPVRLYIDMIHTEKFELYGFVGLNPMVMVDMVSTMEWKDPNGNLIQRNSSSMFDEFYGYYGVMPMRVGMEAQLGFGAKYSFAPRWYVHANGMFGLNTIPAIIGGYTSLFVYRFGGSVGAGYTF